MFLIYIIFTQDGTPIDLTPSLTTDGVVFQYFDTSSAEKEVLYHFYLRMK